MRFVHAAGLAGIAALAIAAPAFAQETTEDKPFSGFYVGAAGGYDVQPNDVGSRLRFDRNLDGVYGDSLTTARGADAFSPGFCNGGAKGQAPQFGCRNDKDGWAYYGRVGVDHQYGNFLGGGIVVGAVGEFGRSEIRDRTSGFSTTPASYVFTRSMDWEASVRGRAGYAVNTTLFYGTAGAGYTRLNHVFGTTNTANNFTGRGDRNVWGALAGGGIEQKLTPHISFGLEYMFHRYKDDDYTVRATAGTTLAGSPVLISGNPFVRQGINGTDIRRSDEYFRWHSLRGTLNFRF